MKNIFLLMIFSIFAFNVSAQEDTEEPLKGKNGQLILPESGEIGLGVNMIPFVNWFGNAFNANTNNQFASGTGKPQGNHRETTGRSQGDHKETTRRRGDHKENTRRPQEKPQGDHRDTTGRPQGQGDHKGTTKRPQNDHRETT